MLRSSSVRARLVAVVAACAAIVAPGVALLAAPSAGAATTHPYSDPIWFPLHTTSFAIGCVGNYKSTNNYATSNGHCGHDHNGYFALNVDIPTAMPQHPDIYPAGEGTVLKITRVSGACVPTGGKASGGNEVVVDHGGGIVSVYQHLNSFAAGLRTGSEVTPTQAIGTAGASGARCRSGNTPGSSYLDFRIHRYGSDALSSTLPIPTLQGCVGGSAATWPSGLPASAFALNGGGTPRSAPAKWTDVPYLTVITTDGVGSCIRSTPTGTTPSAPTAVHAKPANSAVTLSWAPPAGGAGSYVVRAWIYRSSSRSWAACSQSTTDCNPGYYTAGRTATSRTVTGLTVGRTYKFTVSAHNSAGWSTQSSAVRAVPSAPAGAPTYRSLRRTTTAATLYWTMYASNLHGGTLSSYQIAIDYLSHGHPTRWVYRSVSRAATHYTWSANRNLIYRVKLRAITGAGAGAWMAIHTVARP